MDKRALTEALSLLPEIQGEITDFQAVSGGDINQAFRVTTTQRELFLKVNRPELAGMFAEEAKGLEAIASTHTMRTPQVLGHGQTEQLSFLALAWHRAVRPKPSDWHCLGEQLAALHLAEAGTQFGWPTHNFIGSSAQLNQCDSRWAHFFAQQRIRPQLEWLNASLPASIVECTQVIEQKLSHHQPKVSLLHGDLWSGNVMFDKAGPLLIDPAPYWGDAWADIAMTRLFGGFDRAFYQAYQSNFGSCGEPWHELYNLYHLLNHANLFGGHYVHQSLHLLRSLIE